ncbi:RNA polymerase [Chitinophaga parva]|uniref:RNA polymerase n=1 Tax=Chitinophaga parva TaxID=2169414 RepID=A0A2T7BF97_9BACT|nr:sigma-70 family RNA polymerase sigma factor [Chitinophaga parva]PUZ24957.1 RNA polymerase [Chitinophaga parva]
MKLSDKPAALWQKIREGEKEALFLLYDDLYFHLVRYGLSVHSDSDLVKDCVGQLFLKLWDRHQTLNAVGNVQSYLFTTLRRLIINALDAESKVRNMKTEEGEEASYEQIIIAREKDEELKKNLQSALQALSPRQMELIRLKFFEDLSYEEIAHVSAQNVKTSYNTIYEAIKTLRLKLKV